MLEQWSSNYSPAPVPRTDASEITWKLVPEASREQMFECRLQSLVWRKFTNNGLILNTSWLQVANIRQPFDQESPELSRKWSDLVAT